MVCASFVEGDIGEHFGESIKPFDVEGGISWGYVLVKHSGVINIPEILDIGHGHTPYCRWTTRMAEGIDRGPIL